MFRKWSRGASGSTAHHRWRWSVLPVAMVALAAAVIGLAQPAQASTLRWSLQGWTQGTSYWPDAHNGMVVDVINWGIFDGDPVQMWPRRPTPSMPVETNQRWNLDAKAASTQIENVAARGKCLDESAPRNGAVVYIYSCTGAANQKWQFRSLGVDQRGQTIFELVNAQDGRCLDVTDTNPNPGARLQVWSCSGGWNQRFRPALGDQ